MGTGDASQRRPKRRWCQFSLRTMLLAVAVIALLLGLLVGFGGHVWWRFGHASTAFSKVRRVPVGPMPAAETPDDWVRCRLGSVEVVLPPELAKSFGTTGGNPGFVFFQDGRRSILLRLPQSGEDMVRFFKESTAACPELRRLSPAELRLAMYRASWDDFRWSMSRRELAAHRFLVRSASLRHVVNQKEVETLFRDDVEGLLVVAGKVADFQWYSTDGRVWGSIAFVQKPGDIDLSWVRPVCQSLRFNGEVFPDSVTDKKVAELFEIVEP